MSATENSTWYLYTVKGREGPLPYSVIQEMAINGTLRPQDLAWCPGMSEWKEVIAIPSLQTLFQPVKPLDAMANGPFGTTTLNMAKPVELETQSSPAKTTVAMQVSSQVQEPLTQEPLAPASSRFPAVFAFSVALAIAMGAITYAGFPLLVRWMTPFPEIPELGENTYFRLRNAAKANLRKAGPKMEMALALRTDGRTSFYIATNLPEGAPFDLRIIPLAETLVGDPVHVSPIHASTHEHLAKATLEKIPPGYYLVQIESEQDKTLHFERKLFLGGAPDLTYETHLKDFMAVRRGIAKAELDRLRDILSKVEVLTNTDNQAALSLSEIKIVRAKSQAWDIYQSTWARGFKDIRDLLAKPSRFSGKIHHGMEELAAPLQKLHDKHHELVAAVVTAASRQLSPGTVTTARVLAESQALSSDIAAKIKMLKELVNERDKHFENTSEAITEEP
jgi:hypothetical protein